MLTIDSIVSNLTLKEENNMSVKSILDETGIEYNKNDVWTCKNCGEELIGFDEDRPSGKFSLCPDCYNSKIEEYGFIPANVEKKDLTEDEINEMITKYIVYHYEKNNLIDKINDDISELRKLLEQNPTTYHYESPSDPVWSFSPKKGGIKPMILGDMTQIGMECVSDMICFGESGDEPIPDEEY